MESPLGPEVLRDGPPDVGLVKTINRPITKTFLCKRVLQQVRQLLISGTSVAKAGRTSKLGLVLPLLTPLVSLRTVHSSMVPKELNITRTSLSLYFLDTIPTNNFRSEMQKKEVLKLTSKFTV